MFLNLKEIAFVYDRVDDLGNIVWLIRGLQNREV